MRGWYGRFKNDRGDDVITKFLYSFFFLFFSADQTKKKERNKTI